MYIDSSSEDESVSEQTSSHTDLQPQQATAPTLLTAPVTTDVTVTSAMYSAVADVARDDDDEPAVNSAPVASVPAPSSSTVIHQFL